MCLYNYTWMPFDILMIFFLFVELAMLIEIYVVALLMDSSATSLCAEDFGLLSVIEFASTATILEQRRSESIPTRNSPESDTLSKN